MQFTTREQAVAHLVMLGEDEGLARAAMDQYCNYESNHDTRNLIWRMPDEVDNVTCWVHPTYHDYDGDHIPVAVDEAYLFSVFHTFTDMAKITDHGIEFDGELIYTREGYWHPEYK